MSRPYAEVIGDPIAQSKSPAIHNFWLAKLGIDAEYGRFLVRAEEIDTSLALVEQLAAGLEPGTSAAPLGYGASPAARGGVGIVEGWRGTITTRVELAADGTLSRVKPVDPSFFNWPALPVALAETIVPDFPLTNKSFNLSYAGNDL